MTGDGGTKPCHTDAIEDFFGELVQLPTAEQRRQYLNQVCAQDDILRAELEGLLKSHEEAGSFLEQEVAPTTSPTEPWTDELLSRQIGPYKLLQKIGEGGMGTVYMAEQQRPVKRQVALKIIKPGMDSRQVVARFEAERQALAMMDHPNIAKVFEAGTTEDGHPFFVMELVKGIPITGFADQQKLSPEDRLKLFVDVCGAVQHAHQKGIIHRDLKPSNILVAKFDDKPVPKVIDFGVAKATSQTLTERTMFTQLGQIVGTLEYMSPEQAQLNQLDIDTRSDVYSLGVLLYELLTGATPFDRQRLRTAALDEVLRIIREEEPPKPSVKLRSSPTLAAVAEDRKLEPKRLGGLLKGDLDWIVMKALDKDRSRRYDSAARFAHDVQGYMNHEPILARPPTVGYRARKYVRRHRLGVALVAAAAVMLAVGILAILHENRRQRLILHEQQTRIEGDVVGALLEQSSNARSLIEDARQVGIDSIKIRWFSALADVNEGRHEQAIKDLLALRESEGQLSIAAHAVLADAYITGRGDYQEYLQEAEHLRNREPIDDTDRVMLGNALGALKDPKCEVLLRNVLKRRDTPIVRAMLGQAIAARAMLSRNKELAEEAWRHVSVAEIVRPDLSITNSYSVYVRYVAMMHSVGAVREQHQNQAIRSAEKPSSDPFGDLVRGMFYWKTGETRRARAALLRSTTGGDVAASFYAASLVIHSPQSALSEFENRHRPDRGSGGASVAWAFLLAMTPGRQGDSAELCHEIVENYQDYDTRVDALCTALLAGDRSVESAAKELLETSIVDFGNIRDTLEFLAGEKRLDQLEAIVRENPDGGIANYAIGARLLNEADRSGAIEFFQRSASSPDILCAYPHYALAVLKRLEDPSWPRWIKP